MNRLIIIGNGFDLAHGLKTSYSDFINDYWEEAIKKVRNAESTATFNQNIIFEDEFIQVKLIAIPYENIRNMNCEFYEAHQDADYSMYKTKYKEFRETVSEFNNHLRQCELKGDFYFNVVFTNSFFKSLNEKFTIQNWVDIEQEYYNMLIRISKIQETVERDSAIIKLNIEFQHIKNHLEQYLIKAIKTVDKEKYQTLDSVRNAINSRIKNLGPSAIKNDSGIGCLHIRSTKRRLMEREETLILNFNYTHTYKDLYYSGNKNETIINIHGSLEDPNNPIIFGYGDEMDKAYAAIEDIGNNDFLDNIKSINYMMTDNYDRLMNFIASDDYQVMIMGHSCGNSDRLLLNRIFEHPHCIGIQVYYYQYESNGKIVDDYKDKVKNISRMFRNKEEMRERIINYTASSPLVPINH